MNAYNLGKKIDDFDPSNKMFKFHFTKDTCCKLNTGYCYVLENKLVENVREDFMSKRNSRTIVLILLNIYYIVKHQIIFNQ